MSIDIEKIHHEIKKKKKEYKRKHARNSEYLILDMALWYDIREYSKDIIPPDHIMKPDGFWYIYGLKVSVLDGSSLQKRHLEVR